jgi:hypothetical protein
VAKGCSVRGELAKKDENTLPHVLAPAGERMIDVRAAAARAATDVD